MILKTDDIAIVALGSNQGNSKEILREAIERLRPLSAEPLKVSSFWETEPVDCPSGSPPFLNAVAIMTLVADSPEALLTVLKQLEEDFGRQRSVPHAPRPLDLDLIAFGNETRSGPDLIVPHPRACQRRFVLAPLKELAPDYILPGQTQTVGELLSRLPPTPWARRIDAQKMY